MVTNDDVRYLLATFVDVKLDERANSEVSASYVDNKNGEGTVETTDNAGIGV